MSIVISAFPGTGKSHFTANAPEGLRVSDSDSSQFSWAAPKIRHPDWPRNYMDHILGLIEDGVDIILVSSHAEVREALVAAGIPFVAIYPSVGQKADYLERYCLRGSPEAFVNLLDAKWSEWTSLTNVGTPNVVILRPKQYLSDAVKHLVGSSHRPSIKEEA